MYILPSPTDQLGRTYGVNIPTHSTIAWWWYSIDYDLHATIHDSTISTKHLFWWLLYHGWQSINTEQIARPKRPLVDVCSHECSSMQL